MGVLMLFITAAFLNTAFTFTPKSFWRMWDPYRNMVGYKAAMSCFIIYMLAAIGTRGIDDLKAVAKAAVAGAIFEGVYTAAECLILNPGRATGHMTEPNNMGAYLAGSINLLVALAILLPSGSPGRKYVLAGLAASAVALLGTLSRGAYAATAIGFLVLTSFVNRKLLAAGVAVLALSPLWLPERVKARLNETLTSEESLNWRYRDGKGAESSALIAMIEDHLEEEAASGELEADQVRLDASLQARFVVYDAAFRMMMDYPLGVGFGVFPWHLQHYSEYLRFKATHNIYLKIGTEIGLPALLIFLYLIFSFARESFRLARSSTDPEISALAWGMLGYVTALSIAATSVDVYFQVEVNGQFWILMALVAHAPALLAASRAEEAAPAETGSHGRKSEAPALYELVR
jgi:O-antigen ligase